MCARVCACVRERERDEALVGSRRPVLCLCGVFLSSLVTSRCLCLSWGSDTPASSRRFSFR